MKILCKPAAEKMAALVPCFSSSPLIHSSLFHLFSRLPPCCTAQLNSTFLLSFSHVLCSSVYLSSAQHFFSALNSPLSTSSSCRLSDFPMWLQRLNLLAKHTKSHMCICTQKKKPTRIFHRLAEPKCILRCRQPVYHTDAE